MTLAQLADLFFSWSTREAAAGRQRPATVDYYRRLLRPLLEVAGGTELVDLIPWDLERVKTGWHSVQAAQRLLNWARVQGLASDNPFNRVTRPRAGQRSAVLDQADEIRLRRRANPALRAMLLALILTGARPGELRALRWSDYRLGRHPHFILAAFKARDRRGDRRQVRILPVVPRLARLLERLRRRGPARSAPVFRNAEGQAWTGDALARAFRRLRRRFDLAEDLVPYSLRHTAATRATSAGVRDRVLAELLGHTSTRTTARYQHPEAADLHRAARRMTRRRRPA